MAFDPISLAITAALMAAQMAMTAMTKIEGPRLDSLDVTIADYGTQIPRFWGRKRIEGVPIMWAEKLREKKNTSKTKGGKYTEYKYFGTFAVLIADHEIDTVSRIWLDKHLCYDLTKVGPISVALGVIGNALGVDGNQPVKLAAGVNMRVYYGTETQEPDPRMEAWCEDRYGADSCPAYRGYSYIVFQDIPLEKFGNRLPQVTIEAVNQPTVEMLTEEKPDSNGLLQYARFSPDFSRLYIPDAGATDGFKIWDVATRTVMVDSDFTVAGEGQPMGVGKAAVYTLDNLALDSDVYIHSLVGGGGTPVPSTYTGYAIDTVAYNLAGTAREGVYVRAPAGATQVLLKVLAEVVGIDAGFYASVYIGDGGENAWAVGIEGTTLHFYCMDGVRQGEQHEVPSPTGSSAAIFCVHNGQGGFVVRQGTSAFIVSDETFSVTDTATWGNSISSGVAFENCQPGAASIWLVAGSIATEYSLTALSVVRTVDLDDWPGSFSADTAVYDPVNHAIWTEVVGGSRPITIYYLDRVGSDGVQLSDVVDDVCGWCGLTGADTTALTQTVRGYLVTQGSGKDMLAPLLDIHDVDPRPHDFSVEFKVRGSAAAGTILTTEFAKEGDTPRYQVAITQDTDLPRKALFNFADVNADQQTNTAVAQRPLDAMDGVGESTIDLTTYVEEPDEAQQFVDRYFRRLWNSREAINLSLTAQRLALEPADVWNLSLDGVVHTARLRKVTIAGLMLNCEWVRDDPLLHNLNGATGAEMEGRDPDVIYIPLLTMGFFLDIPLVRDPDNSVNPIIYVGGGPYGPGGWSGSGAYQGDGTDYDTLIATTDSASKSTWGTTTGALASANPNLWDYASTVTVILNTGTLESHTEAELNANPLLNQAVIGSGEDWEIIQFATATLTDERTYLLSTFKRGRRGTDWAVGTHAAGDTFVLTEHLAAVELGADEIGDTLSFKAASIGRTIEEAFPIDVDYDAESHRPYTPARFYATKDSVSGDWVLTWRRRTRIGGRWVGTTTIPLGEANENYKVEILDAPDGAVVRTITATAETATYTAAQQVTDGGDVAIGDLDAQVRQVGDLVEGRNATLAA